MFEAIIKDPTILEITLVLIVLVGIAFWQNLKYIAAILGGIYFMYLIFIMTSYSNDSMTVIVEEKFENKTINIVEKESIEVDTIITKVEDKKEISINDDEALLILFELLEKEGLSLGTSSGINIAGAIKLAKELGPKHTIVTILCDTSDKYRSKLFNREFLTKKGLPFPKWL